MDTETFSHPAHPEYTIKSRFIPGKGRVVFLFHDGETLDITDEVLRRGPICNWRESACFVVVDKVTVKRLRAYIGPLKKIRKSAQRKAPATN